MAHGISLREREPKPVDPTAIETGDEAFFSDHPDRKYRIRLPRDEREYQNEFRSLGPHQVERRRIIVARVPPNMVRFTADIGGVGPMFRPLRELKLMPIPFLAFADETIEDRDDVLGPIFKGIMENAGAEMGLGGRSGWW